MGFRSIKTSVLIYEEDTLARLGIIAVLQNLEGVFQVFDTSTDKEVLDILEHQQIDILILDPSSNPLITINLVNLCREKKIRIIAIVPTYRLKSMELFLNHPFDMILERSGCKEFFTIALNKGLHHFGNSQLSTKVQSLRFSATDQVILARLADGKCCKEIAEIVHLSVRTIETRKARLFKKFGIKSTAELVTFGFRTGLLK